MGVASMWGYLSHQYTVLGNGHHISSTYHHNIIIISSKYHQHIITISSIYPHYKAPFYHHHNATISKCGSHCMNLKVPASLERPHHGQSPKAFGFQGESNIGQSAFPAIQVGAPAEQLRLDFPDHIYFWVNYNCDLTGIMFSKGNHPQMALIQVSEIF